jgi:hypothetical protein
MPKVADFVTFIDTRFGLAIGADIDKTLAANIPDVPADGEGALLTWNVHHSVDEGSPFPNLLHYEVRVNDSLIEDGAVSVDPELRTRQEVIPTGLIHKGENTIEFRLKTSSAFGAILFISDVTLWYRKNV